MNRRWYEDKTTAKAYSKYRPTYPDSVFVEIIKYCRQFNPGELDLAVDVGCGNGQSTLPLAKYFNKVVGIDGSEIQILEAENVPSNVCFRVGQAEDLGFLDDESVDLVTAAEAFHWFDAERFYSEAIRVLKPGGSLIIYAYWKHKLDGEKGQNIVDETEFITLKNYWADNKRYGDNMYADVVIPFANRSRNDNLQLSKNYDVEEFVGYVSTWTPWNAYFKEQPQSAIFTELYERLSEVYTDPSTKQQKKIHVEWSTVMLYGNKPL